MLHRLLSALTVFAGGALFGAVLFASLAIKPPAQGAPTDLQSPNVASLAAEIELLKGRLPDQAHAMQDVGYHFSNLWYAGQQQNWPLAQFYWAETRSHLRWAVRIIPKRKDAAGQEVDLQMILQAYENAPLKQLEDAITAQNQTSFAAAYHTALEGCYACHKASDKPFLRLQIPSEPAAPIMNFDPRAMWPK